MSDIPETVIKVKDVVKDFKLPHDLNNSIKGRIINFGKQKFELQHALKGVTFDVKAGDFFGIVGRNGSGKSTLLKMLAGIYEPTSGSVDIKGKLTPFIELGVGFNPELSGRDNVYLNGALLGFNRKQIDGMYESIVEFAELKEFMDQKLKNYSSGMQVRLAFSIAVKADSDILLLDEVLAVGDAKFQQKCFDYFYELKDRKKTVIFISHDMDAVQKFCTRAAYLKDGRIVYDGKPADAANKYLADLYGETQDKNIPKKDNVSSKVVTRLSAEIIDKTKAYQTKDIVSVKLSYFLKESINTEVRLAVVKDGIAVAHINTKTISISEAKGKHTVVFDLSLHNFLQGIHKVDWGVYNPATGERLNFQAESCSFYVEHEDDTRSGVFQMDGQWKEL